MPRSTTLTMSPETALEFIAALLRARLLLIQYAPTMEPDDRLQAEAAYGGLQHLLDVIERGVEEAVDSLPVDAWQRPLLPAGGEQRPFRHSADTLEGRFAGLGQNTAGTVPPSAPSSDPRSGENQP